MCGSKEGLSARLEFYEDANSASTEDLMIWQILFTDVKYVCCKEEQQRKIITIGLEGSKESISFRICADSRSSTIKWYMYCSLLLAIPKYTIPEIPKENDALQQGIDRYSDSRKFDAGTYSYIAVCLHT